MPRKSHFSAESQRAHNLREKAAYAAYKAVHGVPRGGQKGFRAIMRRRPISQRPASALGLTQRSRLETSLRVLARSRRKGETLTKASRDAHTTPDTVRRYLGSSGFRKKGGRWAPTKSDSLVRTITTFSNGRRVVLSVRGSEAASTLGRYDSDVSKFITDPARDPSILKKWEGRTVRDIHGVAHPLESDGRAIREAVDRIESDYGAFDFYPEGGADVAVIAEV